MKAVKLYKTLKRDFILPEMREDWNAAVLPLKKYVLPAYKKNSIGLVLDFAKTITHVFTAVEPSPKVMKEILRRNISDALLFVHHPAVWNINLAPKVFSPMDLKLVKEFKRRRIAVFNLHHPLDAFGKYSTSAALAEALGLKQLKPFAKFDGVRCGVIGKTTVKTTAGIKDKLKEITGHKVKLYPYGKNSINLGKVAVVAGGGNGADFLAEAFSKSVNTFISGISVKNRNPRAIKAHEFAEKHGINILGGTHNSTEKFACMKMRGYFEALGLPAEFIDDKPCFEDM